MNEAIDTVEQMDRAWVKETIDTEYTDETVCPYYGAIRVSLCVRATDIKSTRFFSVPGENE